MMDDEGDAGLPPGLLAMKSMLDPQRWQAVLEQRAALMVNEEARKREGKDLEQAFKQGYQARQEEIPPWYLPARVETNSAQDEVLQERAMLPTSSDDRIMKMPSLGRGYALEGVDLARQADQGLPQSSPLSYAMASALAVQNRLAVVTEALEVRLAKVLMDPPVKGQSPNVAGQPRVDPLGAPLAEKVMVLTERLQAVNDRLQRLLDRLAL